MNLYLDIHMETAARFCLYGYNQLFQKIYDNLWRLMGYQTLAAAYVSF